MDYYSNVMGPQGFNGYGYPQNSMAGMMGGYGNSQGYSHPNMPWLDDPNYNQKYSQYPQQSGQNNTDMLSALMKSGAAANYNFTGTNLAPQRSIADEMGNLANASYNPNNPTYQAIYNNENQSAKQDLSSAIAEMSNQNRKLSMLGRTPLFSPERGGEQMFRQTIQGYQTAQDTARARARQIIGAGQGALNMNFQNQNNLAQQQTQNNQKQAYGMGNIADMLPFLAKLL